MTTQLAAVKALPTTKGRGSWGRRSHKHSGEIKHPIIGTEVECELRTGNGVKRWTCKRPVNFGHRVRQSFWCSPALQRCLDRFYDMVDYRIMMSERTEYRRNCEEHERFIAEQRARKARKNLAALQRGKAVR